MDDLDPVMQIVDDVLAAMDLYENENILEEALRGEIEFARKLTEELRQHKIYVMRLKQELNQLEHQISAFQFRPGYPDAA